MNFDKLSPKTKAVFKKLSGDKFLNAYTLVRGSALTIRIEHRSETIMYSGDIPEDSIAEHLEAKEIVTKSEI